MSLVLIALINWLLKLKMHANMYLLKAFFFCMKVLYDFYIFERLSRMHENKIFFLCFSIYVFVIFQRKSGILVLNLYPIV
jgi:hypothetical protein